MNSKGFFRYGSRLKCRWQSTTNTSFINAIEFNTLMKNCRESRSLAELEKGNEGPVAIAVSGGVDSMALTLLAHEWCSTRNVPLLAITVDHRLRPESTVEAKRVGNWLQQRDISHVITTCQWPTLQEKPSNQLQARAREMRYQLLKECCQKHGVKTLWFAHHWDDQMETILLRIGRASGINGLAGIPAQRMLSSEIQILRPFLSVRKSRLEATCEHIRFQQEWVNDPSNGKEAFDRVRVRKVERS